MKKPKMTKEVEFEVELPDALYQQVVKAAKAQNIEIAEFIRNAMEQFVRTARRGKK